MISKVSQMVVVRLQETFRVRFPEWLMALITVSWAVLLFGQPTMFAVNPVFAELAKMASQSCWGWCCLLLGAGRFTVLVINGSWRATPHFRVACAILSCFLWLQIVFGLWHLSIPDTGMAVYPWFLVTDMWCIHVAARDAAITDKRFKQGLSAH